MFLEALKYADPKEEFSESHPNKPVIGSTSITIGTDNSFIYVSSCDFMHSAFFQVDDSLE